MADRPRRGGDVTVWDVASRAGVSKSTVSKFLTDTPYVAPDTAARIQRAIDELGYEPSGLGRGLASGRTGLIGVVVPSVLNPFYTELVHAVDAEIVANGLTLMLGTTEYDPQRRIVRELRQKGVDGMVIASAEVVDEELLLLESRGCPYVLASRHVEIPSVDYVVVDGVHGAGLAIDHLHELGHRRITHIAGPLSVLQFRDRARGYEQAMQTYGLDAHVEVVRLDTPSWEDSRAAAIDLLRGDEEGRPSAIFASTDFMALGVLAAARHLGLHVPGDVSVMGFDGIGFGSQAYVPLTTVDSHIQEIATRATGLLLRRLRDDNDDKIAGGTDGEQDGARHQTLRPELVVRESTAQPAASLFEHGEPSGAPATK